MIDHALVLAAGHGSRLRDHVAVPHKALVQLEGEPLLLRTCRMLDRLGLREITIVTGHEGVALRSAIEGASGIEAKLGFVENPDWRLANGLSVLAAADVLEGTGFDEARWNAWVGAGVAKAVPGAVLLTLLLPAFYA